MTPKRLWLLVIILLTLYITVYVGLALNGIHDYSRHFSWVETLLMSIISMIALGGILAAFPALIPFGKKKISDRYFGVTFPIMVMLVIIVMSFYWAAGLHRRHVHGVPTFEEMDEQYLKELKTRDSITLDSIERFKEKNLHQK